MRRLWCIMSIAVMVAACGGHKSRSQSVWDLYDVRQPASTGQPYPQDNDARYKQPAPSSIWDLD